MTQTNRKGKHKKNNVPVRFPVKMVAVSTLAYGSLDALLDDEEDIVQHGRGQLIRLHTVQLDRLGIIIKKFFK